MAFCHITLVDDEGTISDANVQLYLDTSEENEDRATIVKEKGEETGEYFVVLEPGFYWCVASKPGFAKI